MSTRLPWHDRFNLQASRLGRWSRHILLLYSRVERHIICCIWNDINLIFMTILWMFRCFYSCYFVSHFWRWQKCIFYSFYLDSYIDYLSCRQHRQFHISINSIGQSSVHFNPLNSSVRNFYFKPFINKKIQMLW